MASDLENGLMEAIERCIEHARDAHYLTIEGIAAKMGLVGGARWAFYKWLQEGRIPANRINEFESVCHHTAVTRFLARASGQIAAPLLSPETLPQTDLGAAQVALARSMARVTESVHGALPRADAVRALSDAIEVLHALRHKLAGRAQP